MATCLGVFAPFQHLGRVLVRDGRTLECRVNTRLVAITPDELVRKERRPELIRHVQLNFTESLVR